ARPVRAPVLGAVIARRVPPQKGREVEPVPAGSWAARGLLLAGRAQGLGAVWRTGGFAYDRHVAEGLGLTAGEQLLGFSYLGTPEGGLRIPPALEPKDFVEQWSGESSL